jgi:serine/threonine protein kinase
MGEIFGRGTVLLGKYRVESVLGRGGMGVVLKVVHLDLEEELALKVLLPEGATNQDVTARFLREAQAVVRLRGEHIARVRDVGVLPDGLPFMVMEYLRGIDLCGEIARRVTLPPGEAIDYVLQACEALAEAHAHGIVHRDIKPANLFLTARPDGSPLIKVLDFGISKSPPNAAGVATRTEVVMGTPGYMSPEQMKASKDVDPRTDIWALGVVLYECLSGRRPFQGESFAATVLMAGMERPPPLDPRIAPGVHAAVLQCLEKDRRARFQSVAALAAALAPFARNQREAATIVERATHMQDGLHRGIEPPLHWEPSPATTLSQSAGSTLARPRRRLAVGRGASLGTLVLLTIMALIVSVQLYGPDEQPRIETVSAAGGQPTTPLVVETTGSPSVTGSVSLELLEPGGPADPSTGFTGSGTPGVPASQDITVTDDTGSAGELRADAGAGTAGTGTAPGCDAVDVRMRNAQKRDNAGDPRSALRLMQAVLGCPQGQSVMKYIIAGRYACRARDHEAASEYHKQVPVELQEEIERACLKVGIDLLDH